VLTMLIDMFIHKLRNDSGVEDPHNLRIFDRPATTESDKPISADGVEGDADGVVSARSQSYRDGVTVQETSADADAVAVAVADDAGGSSNPFAADEKEEKRLLTSAMLTGVAIILHNIPEGLATFVAAAKDPAVGASLAIAIGVHNIPEGICVAVPIYFATGNKCKAFFWGTASGLAETFAGAAGWIVLSQRDTDMSALSYAVLFGVVGGMMVYISMNELLVTALKYDPENHYTSFSAFAGMFVMAFSLSLFQ